MLSVTNGNKFELTDRFDGVDFVFPPGKTVAISEDAARHIFGIGEADKSDKLRRLGWMMTSGDYESAMQKLNNFSFNVVTDINAGDLIEAPSEEGADTEQGTAPLQAEELPKAAPDGAVEGNSEAPKAVKSRKFSDILGGGEAA